MRPIRRRKEPYVDQPELSCTLTGPELAARVEEWRRVTAQAKTRTLEGTRAVSVYPNDPDLLDQLRRLIDAEKDCCSFMEFRIEESHDEVVVHLEVPEEMKEVLGAMVTAL